MHRARLFGTKTALENPGSISDTSLSLNSLKLGGAGKYLCIHYKYIQELETFMVNEMMRYFRRKGNS